MSPSPSNPDCVMTECVPPFVDGLYRWFFTTAIIVALTAGATWGGWILWQIGVAGKFTGVSVHAVNAHGHAQIYGWMGLFIMGFAYHVLPRFWRGPLAFPRLAPIVLGLVAGGILVRTLGMTGFGSFPAAFAMAIAGCVLEAAATALFAAQMIVTCRRGKTAFRPESGFLMGAMVWLVAMSLLDAFHTWATMAAPTRDALLWQIATFQAPLRDLQIHGVALFMILGISTRMFPGFFCRPQSALPPERRGWWAVGLLFFAVLGEVAIFLAYRFTHRHAVAAFLMLPWLMLAAGVCLQALPWKLWKPLPAGKRADRSDKFLRTAYLWLAISLAMLLMLPVYQAATKIPFSHAYYGAIRHAITVGFVSQMILGMSARLVPSIRGRPAHGLARLWPAFVLVNLGCFLRVLLQTLTDVSPLAFSLVPLSAVFEVAGLAWWATDLLAIMWKSRAIAAAGGGMTR